MADQWRLSNGTLSTNAKDAIRVAPDVVLELARNSGALIPAEYVLNMALNETGGRGDYWPAANQIGDNGKSIGMLQVSENERTAAGVPGDLTDPPVNVRAFVKVQERDLRRIATAARLDVTRPIPREVFHYLAWAHNAGVGEPLESIQRFGLDWEKLKRRDQNAYMRDKLIPYAERATAGAGRYGRSLGGVRPLISALIDATSGDDDDGSGWGYALAAGAGGLLLAALL